VAVIDEIVKWANTELLSWQADAVRRLLTQGTLTSTDEEELLLMLKSEHKLLKPTETAPKPKPLVPTCIPGTHSTSQQITLYSIKNLTNVNQIPHGSSLTFGEKGLTIIYGDNASGKSGYARVLKKACRARHTTERIYPNVYAQAPNNPASASFVISTSGVQQPEVQWVDETSAPEILANICVFDSKCARIIIDEDNEVVYLPYGASVFHDLNILLKNFKAALHAERPQPIPPSTNDIPPTTQSGKFIAALNVNTTAEALAAATKWSQADDEKLLGLTQEIAKATAEDPRQQAIRLRNLKTRVSNLKANLGKIQSSLSPEAVATLQRQISEVNSAKRAFAIASQQSPSLIQEPLPGIGDNVWKLLYQAAEEYSTRVAYKDKDFPFTGPDSLCVLCMQPLEQDAKERFHRFKSFMEDATKKRLDSVTADLTTISKQLADLDFGILDSYKDAFDEITIRNKTCADLLKAFVEKALVIKMSIVSAVQGLTIVPPVELPTCPISDIDKILASMDHEAEKLHKSADAENLAALQSQKAELDARKKLVAIKHDLSQYLRDLTMGKLYDLCIKDTDTTLITKKGRQIVSTALTKPFETLLNEQLSDFDAGIKLSLQPRGVAGETIHKLALSNCELPMGAKVTDILSEGEQRVVSIASFLAELSACGHSNPIIFDDPVSSLDHNWREKVAYRLTKEAAARQVIVFTHDIVFTCAAMDAAESTKVPLTIRCILRRGNVPGTAEDTIPWKAANVTQSIDALEKQVAQLSRTWKSLTTEEYSQAARPVYSKMRATWEKSIEEVVFYRTVRRFRAYIRVNSDIMKTTVLDISDCKTLLAAHKKCCDITEAHDNIGPRNAPVPNPDKIEKDLALLKSWVNHIKSKQKTLP
jgi:energy-coupling factor transporter ATP-binding protein EcfA2